MAVSVSGKDFDMRYSKKAHHTKSLLKKRHITHCRVLRLSFEPDMQTSICISRKFLVNSA